MSERPFDLVVRGGRQGTPLCRADLAVWETRGTRPIRDEDLFSRAAHSVYRGRELTAWPAVTVRRGEIVFEDGKIVGAPGAGRNVPRGRTDRPL